MAQTIIRLYPNAAAADAAVKDLKAHFFGDDEIAVVDPSAGATVDEIAAAIAKKKILKAHAAALAPGVANGGTMVAVRAAFGVGVKATTLLDRHGPIPSGLEAPASKPDFWDEAAPFSSSIQVKPLLNDPAPLSSFWQIPTLLDHNMSCSSMFGMVMISKNATPLSSAIGWKLISDNPAPLSSRFGLPLLK